MASLFDSLDLVLQENMEDTEIFQSAIMILTSYILIGKEAFFNQKESTIRTLLNICLKNRKNSIIAATVEFFKVAIRLLPNTLNSFTEQLTELFFILISPNCPRAKFATDRDSGACITALMFDLLLLRTPYFFKLIEHIQDNTQNRQVDHETPPIQWFVQTVLDKIKPSDFVVLHQENLSLIGLTLLLDIGDPHVTFFTPNILVKCFDFLKDIEYKSQQVEEDYKEKNSLIVISPAYRILYQLHKQHISARTDVMKFFREKLRLCIERNGPEWCMELQRVLPPEISRSVQGLIEQ